MALKVGLVGRCVNTPHIRGMGKYVYELLQQTQPRDDLSWVVFGDDPRYPMTVPAGAGIVTDVFPFRGDRFHFWEQIGLPRRAAGHAVDLLHCTEGTLPLWQPVPTVVTVHDTLMWEERSSDLVSTIYFDTLLPAALKKCAAIVTDSESSRDDILGRWPWLEVKLSVVPMGIAAEYFTDEAARLPESIRAAVGEAPYVVYFGGPIERKRFTWARDVVARCGDPDLKLVACGFAAEARLAAENALPRELRDKVVFAPFLSDAELRGLTRGARAALYPTLYEGFGFPAVEAQAIGVPVIFSALGSLKELVGPLALVVPPYEMDAWLGALAGALSMTDEERMAKAEAARSWARRFMWSENFSRHLTIYREVIARRGAA